MSYAPKHAKHTSLMVAVLGNRDKPSDMSESHTGAHSDAPPVPKPRATPDENVDQPASSLRAATASAVAPVPRGPGE